MTSWLHEERLQAVEAAVRDTGAARLLDLGCGDGDLLVRLAADAGFTALVGIDLCAASLDRLRLRLSRMTVRAGRVEVRLASMTAPDDDLRDFDCAVLVETIEHVDPAELSRLERALFRVLRPRAVIVTTPNAEFNRLLGVPPNRYRHPDHRFEWDRARFRGWVRRAAGEAGYDVACTDIAGHHPDLGGASQMAVFRRAGPAGSSAAA